MFIEGSAVTMPWADTVPAILQAWYLGNASGDAIADVIFGKHNPSGRLPLTFPKRLEDVPAFGHFHSEDGVVSYIHIFSAQQNFKMFPCRCGMQKVCMWYVIMLHS